MDSQEQSQDNSQQPQDNSQEVSQNDNSQLNTELQPIKILYLFDKLEKLNRYLIKNNKDNIEFQLFLNNMSNLSYPTIIAVTTNLLDKYGKKYNISTNKEDIHAIN